MSGTYSKRTTGEGVTAPGEFHTNGKRIRSIYPATNDIKEARQIQNFMGMHAFDVVYSDADSGYIVLAHKDAILMCHYGQGRIVSGM